jgi:TPR repeat protein
MNSIQRHDILELKFVKRYRDAVSLARQFADQGDLAAQVMLARMWEVAGLSREEAEKVLEAAHRAVAPDDVIAHLELYGAYAEGLGEADYETKARRSFDHLLMAAERDAGHSYSITVARVFRTGSLVVDADPERARTWYQKAEAQGSPDASGELKSLRD